MSQCRQDEHEPGGGYKQNIEHYRQRAGAGLIVTEGIYPSDMGQGYLFIPGLCNDADVKDWRKVTEAVHCEGGTIFCRLMYNGRLSDPLLLPDQADPIAPSVVQLDPTARHYTLAVRAQERAVASGLRAIADRA